MVKLSLSRKKNTVTYLPGQEIYFSSGSFGWETEDEAVNVCHNRIYAIVALFIFIYAVIIIRIFNVCLVDGIKLHQDSITYYRPKSHIVSPVGRANITDRNGVVVATNLPTVNLTTHPHKITNPAAIAKRLTEVFP